ncbi:zinc finger MYM-type protein 1-like [Diabrotica undecimpunctata]|uniref:zinc finger MYM-type protein 1-like n=1 Tax=Diabrotica undecimpunctata TaxID=50387 RepID=UPI003B632A12
MASIWVKVLVPINYRSQLLQTMDATLDVESSNIESLIDDLSALRNNWDKILSECNVTNAYGIEPELSSSRARKRKTFHDETATENVMLNLSPEERFKTEVFYTIIDVLVANLKTRFTALREIEMKFSFLWKYNEMDESTISESCVRFAEEYNSDVSRDLVDEMIYLKTVSKSNISDTSLIPAKLLNKLVSLNVTNLFPNVCIAVRIFCCLPVSVSQAERSFSVLSRIKNCLRSTMGQQRLSDLGLLSIESKLAKTLDFDHVIQNFADMKARKVML